MLGITSRAPSKMQPIHQTAASAGCAYSDTEAYSICRQQQCYCVSLACRRTASFPPFPALRNHASAVTMSVNRLYYYTSLPYSSTTNGDTASVSFGHHAISTTNYLPATVTYVRLALPRHARLYLVTRAPQGYIRLALPRHARLMTKGAASW